MPFAFSTRSRIRIIVSRHGSSPIRIQPTIFLIMRLPNTDIYIYIYIYIFNAYIHTSWGEILTKLFPEGCDPATVIEHNDGRCPNGNGSETYWTGGGAQMISMLKLYGPAVPVR